MANAVLGLGTANKVHGYRDNIANLVSSLMDSFPPYIYVCSNACMLYKKRDRERQGILCNG